MSNTKPSTVRSRARWGVLALISLITMINYLDRTVLGIAAPALRTDLAIDAATMGIIFSAFSWTYAFMQVPGGVFLDRFGTKLTYFLSLTFWSLFTLLQALATGVYSLVFYRVGLGLCETPCFPTNSRIVATWFPQHERATATSIYTVGEYIGLAFFSPFLFWLMAAYSWHALFILVGVVGLLFALVWYWRYREPRYHAGVNEAELDYIAKGGGFAKSVNDSRAVLLEQCRETAVLPASLGRRHRSVRRQFDAGVLLDLVPDLSRHRTPHALGEGRLLRRAALPRRRYRRARRRLGLRQTFEDDRLRQHRAQGAHHRRSAARFAHRDRKLDGQQRRCDHGLVDCVLRTGHGRPRLDADLRYRAEVADGADRRDSSTSRPILRALSRRS